MRLASFGGPLPAIECLGAGKIERILPWFNSIYQQHCGDMKLVENGQTIVTISQCFFKEMLSYLTTAVNRNKQKSAVNSLGTTFSRGLIHIWLVCAEVLTLYKSEYFLPLGNRKM